MRFSRRDLTPRTDDRFSGHILGVGSTSGVRIVVGRWPDSPLGDFADCMVALPDGRRVLLAPSDEVAEYVSATYHFEEVCVVPVEVAGETGPGGAWVVAAGPLRLRADLGRRTALGCLLRAVPARWSATAAVTAVTDPVARVVMRGVRTRGTAGGGRAEYYGAGDMHAVTALEGEWDGRPLGALAPVEPPPRFGFSGTPRRPSVVAVTTTVRR